MPPARRCHLPPASPPPCLTAATSRLTPRLPPTSAPPCLTSPPPSHHLRTSPCLPTSPSTRRPHSDVGKSLAARISTTVGPNPTQKSLLMSGLEAASLAT
ncbi:hypothetical protein GUJ93_ZPchr0001g31240 [Zizania palustris]|uniref:Uncharacterized protein n=1 Tax=Zizania palustris TaxID=103762 RepID=A0A8J5RTW9_ZIZPA|nr:hypothetical protein GUJ93_ZPchr0001g31240 [Zizania palustris]